MRDPNFHSFAPGKKLENWKVLPEDFFPSSMSAQLVYSCCLNLPAMTAFSKHPTAHV